MRLRIISRIYTFCQLFVVKHVNNLYASKLNNLCFLRSRKVLISNQDLKKYFLMKNKKNVQCYVLLHHYD